MPVWAILVANVSSDWGLFTLLTNIPTFLKDVLRFDIQSVSFSRPVKYRVLSKQVLYELNDPTRVCI